MFEEDNIMMPETNTENIEKAETVTTAENTETVNMGDSESRKALYPEQQPVYYNAQSMNDMQYQNPVQPQQNVYSTQNPAQTQQNMYRTQNPAQPQQNVYSTQNPPPPHSLPHPQTPAWKTASLHCKSVHDKPRR